MADSLFDTNPDHGNQDARAEIIAKWKDKPADELLNAKAESDLYIKTMERRMDEMRNDLLAAKNDTQTRANLEDLLNQLNSAREQPQREQPHAIEDQPKPLNVEDIDKLVTDRMQQHRLREIETSNFNAVQKRLNERFGQNTANVLKEQASTLGLSDEDVNSLAKKSPEAFFRVMGLNEQQTGNNFQAPPRTDRRMDSYVPKTVKRDYAYYQELKKTQPMLYLDPKIAVQMHNDAMEQGEAFFSGARG
jgi:hypothetical protein